MLLQYIKYSIIQILIISQGLEMLNQTKNEEIDKILLIGNLIRKSEYTHSLSPLLLICNICKHERWVQTVGHLIYRIKRGKKCCPLCSSRIKHSNEEIDIRLKGKNIIRLSNWKNDLTLMLWQCNICNHIWKTRATKILNEDTGCPDCSYKDRNKYKRLTDAIIQERIKHRPITKLDLYPGNISIKIKWQCNECNFIWMASTEKIVNQYTGCIACADVGGGKFGRKIIYKNMLFDSVLEKDCYLILERTFKKIDRQVPYPNNKRMKCDFYISEKKTWIEVSNFKTKEYLNRIQRKENLINIIGERFLFCSGPKSLIKALTDP